MNDNILIDGLQNICLQDLYKYNLVETVLTAFSSSEPLTAKQLKNKISNEAMFFDGLFKKLINDSKMSDVDKVLTERILQILISPLYDEVNKIGEKNDSNQRFDK